ELGGWPVVVDAEYRGVCAKPGQQSVRHVDDVAVDDVQLAGHESLELLGQLGTGLERDDRLSLLEAIVVSGAECELLIQPVWAGVRIGAGRPGRGGRTAVSA